MEIKVENEIPRNLDEEKAPLLENSELPEVEKNLIQQAISQTFKSTAHLANLLPTDSFKDQKGNVCYGFATTRGLWIIDGSATLPLEVAAKYKLKFIDFMHAIMSILVFAAVALFDQNVVSCFYPTPSYETQELLTALPVAIGVICSMLFVVFPTQRHGIGFPLTC
ncbi:hypothetical protein MTR67_009354 [Solanum verrucosum]|uniref:Uncharacterized protein n=1 Tax=Solanum verrucosum TaxID=315347 RepID=A0AAF0TER6_SOLVR|nr:hypothetical protein MTR67_009354 [Solanum verrucosum]